MLHELKRKLFILEFQTKEHELGQLLLVVNYKDCLLLINC